VARWSFGGYVCNAGVFAVLLRQKAAEEMRAAHPIGGNGMLRARICTAALLLGFSAAPMFAKNASAASATELAQISDRGRSLYEYDEAAWHATDAVKATKSS
jgi:hypothetical protein